MQKISVLPAYDVATFRLSTTGSGDTNVDTNLTTIRGMNWPLVDMLQSAFDVQRDMLIGLPDWARQAHYDVSAKISDPHVKQLKALPRGAWSAMQLVLLEERFQMKWHYETRTLNAYELVVAKGGMKLTPEPPNPQTSGMSAHDADLTRNLGEHGCVDEVFGAAAAEARGGSHWACRGVQLSLEVDA